MRKTITLLDLFSGIGGFHLGLQRAGFKVKSYNSEIDKYANQVYKHKFKNSTHVGSVTDVQGSELPRINAITFGSPCQDFSLAGKRKGMGGERSSLILEAIRLIKECRPDFFIWENVKGTFSSNNRQDFAAILQAFANIGGYRIEWQLLNTKWFLPQNRERVYLVGYAPGKSRGQVFPIGKINQKDKYVQRQQGDTNTITARYDGIGNGAYIIERQQYAQEKIAAQRGRSYRGQPQQLEYRSDGNTNTLSSVQKDNYVVTGGLQKNAAVMTNETPALTSAMGMGGGHTPIVNRIDQRVYRYTQKALNETLQKEKLSNNEVKALDLYNRKSQNISPTLTEPHHNTLRLFEKGKIRRLTPLECERLQGFPDNWTQEGVNGPISDTQRYKMCGNAVTVDVVEAVGKQILKL